MQLIYYPNNLLTEICHPTQYISEHSHHTVSERKRIQKDRAKLASDMWKIMDEHNGVGLSAPQVGLNIRMFVWKPIQKVGLNRAIWNPILNITTKTKSYGIEGCLSFPGVNVTIRRPIQSILTGTNSFGKPVTVYGGSIATRIWQHEIDHLDGKLIIDDMNRDDTLSNRDALKTLLNKHRGLTE